MAEIDDLARLKEELREWARVHAYFESRIGFAEAHEALVAEHIRAAGWTCGPWGQALLTDELRDALRATDCPARWSPDLLAVHGVRWLFVDAKAEIRTDTPNFSIELSAFRSHVAWRDANRQLGSFVYVWDDLTCSYIEDLEDGQIKVGEYHGSGSGTPFGLVSKTVTRPFESVFGVA